MIKYRDTKSGLRVAVDNYIPGQEYEFATVEAIDARIAHLNFLIGRYTGPGANELPVERDMLRFQWRGNAEIRARQFAGEVAKRCSCVWCNP